MALLKKNGTFVLQFFPFAPPAHPQQRNFYFNCLAVSDNLLAWPPLQSLAVKKNFFLCKFWAVKNF